MEEEPTYEECREYPEVYNFLRDKLQEALAKNTISPQEILWKEDRRLVKAEIEKRGYFNGFTEGVYEVARLLEVDIWDEPDGTEY